MRRLTTAAGAPTTRALPSRSATTLFRWRLQLLLLVVLAWCILWILFSTEFIRRVDHSRGDDRETLLSSRRSANTRTRDDASETYAFLPLTAYVEPSHLYSYYQWLHGEDALLNLRTHGPDQLLKFTYPRLKTCDDLPSKLPVFHHRDQDAMYGSNVHNTKSLYDDNNRLLIDGYAKTTCPVDADPFLPWIHDIFPSNDGTRIEFVAHNKRRCNTDPNIFKRELRNLEPQVALWQPVPITIMSAREVQELVPNEKSLWSRRSKEEDSTNTAPRYRLATSFEEATAQETRFICQFHRLVTVEGHHSTVQKKVVGETLSVYPYNYELANLRKPGSKPMLTRPEEDKKNSAHNEQVWNSVLHFSCPVPPQLQHMVASGDTVMNNTATLFVDLVPIRTRPRLTRNGYVPPIPNGTMQQEWGDKHVLPEIESSGRWSNIPICLTPQKSRGRRESGATVSSPDTAKQQTKTLNSVIGKQKEDHFLIGCTWAAASFSTRGQSVQDSSTSSRLLEWLTYHLEIAGFDHMYIYDNTDNETASLEDITNLFPGQVTRIPWPHRVCNNNKPSHANAGERSSQYAAETSCRVRYGSASDWMIFFDNDEYLIPQGKWGSIREWLKEGVGEKSPNHILSFYQSRAVPRVDRMEESDGLLSKRSKNMTYLETYDCESDPLPKPPNKWRAMKQIYRPWYVLNHFVHYSTVTRRIVDHPDQVSALFMEKAPFERRVVELQEAFMLHTKTTPPEATKDWKQRCSGQRSTKPCPVGVPFPLNVAAKASSSDPTTGLVYNCYQHERIQRDLIPKLKAALLRTRNR